jgi:hypothetical protein
MMAVGCWSVKETTRLSLFCYNSIEADM